MQAGRQTDRQGGRQTDRQAGRQADRQAECFWSFSRHHHSCFDWHDAIIPMDTTFSARDLASERQGLL